MQRTLPPTLIEALLQRTEGPEKDKPYLLFKPDRSLKHPSRDYQSISYGDFGLRVKRCAAGLLGAGIERGDRIAIVSESRPEWVTTDFASLAIGAVTVPMFPTLTPKQVEYILAHSGAKAVVVSNDLQLKKVLKSAPQCPDLQTIIICNPEVATDTSGFAGTILFFQDLLDSSGDRRAEIEQSLLRAKPEDVVTIIYTSGTTGDPKGVMLTNRNFITNLQGAVEALPEINSEDVFLSFLPLSHAFERIASYLIVIFGLSVAYAESVDTVADNMLEVRPTIMTGVPRFYERVYGRIMRAREKLSPRRRAIFDWALAIGAEHARHIEGSTRTLRSRLFYPIADKLVLEKIRARTGGRIRYFVSGAAALPAEVGRAFASIGIPIIEGYGMTECSPIISISPWSNIRWGAVGKPISNIEVKIAEDGEILTRGPHVMKGYLNDDVATHDMIDDESWLHTGDIGDFDSAGYLWITDRKKHLFVSTGGKNIAPGPIEGLLTQSQFIDQVMLVGDKRNHCTALIVPDMDAVREAFESKGHKVGADITKDQLLRDLLQQEIDRLQRDVATYERVRKFAVIPESFTVENGMMTPTLKVKRKEVEKRYADVIDSLYATRELNRLSNQQIESAA